MRDRYHGHPLGGTLIIGAIFSVGLAFYLATPPAMLPSTSTQAPLCLLAAPIAAHPPAIVSRVAGRRAGSRPAEPVAVVQEEIAHGEAMPATAAEPVSTSEPALRALSWSTVPTAYPAALSDQRLATAAQADRGAVTQALATAASAVRSAFKKAF